MRIVIDLPASLTRLAAKAVEEGRYQDIDALMVTALGRLFVEESSDSAGGSFSHAKQPSFEDAASARPRLSTTIGEYVHPTAPDSGWLWGMINRVFPLKVAVRTCAEMARERPVLLQSLHENFADRGQRVGQLLAASDRTHGRRRNEALAVGFPLSSDQQKARVRFAHQFIGRRSSVGKYVGGAFETALIGVTDPGTDWVAPTEMGWQFAKLHNPVLDDAEADGPNLTAKEQSFYLKTIARKVPSETNAFRAILEALSPGPLEASALAIRLSPFQHRDLPDSIRNSSRSGALARLAEVGGIIRTAIGRTARYEITGLGRIALEFLPPKQENRS